jgi:hypothetical protein
MPRGAETGGPGAGICRGEERQCFTLFSSPCERRPNFSKEQADVQGTWNWTDAGLQSLESRRRQILVIIQVIISESAEDIRTVPMPMPAP